MTKEIEVLIKKILSYLDTAKPGDARNAKVIDLLAKYDADMAKLYTEREVRVQQALAKIEKEKKEHRKNQMTILYKKYVDAAVQAKEDERREMLQQLKEMEKDLLDILKKRRSRRRRPKRSERHGWKRSNRNGRSGTIRMSLLQICMPMAMGSQKVRILN